MCIVWETISRQLPSDASDGGGDDDDDAFKRIQQASGPSARVMSQRAPFRASFQTSEKGFGVRVLAVILRLQPAPSKHPKLLPCC
jgi:hypothetical protein